MEEKDLYDITIIGGGPTGLFAAYYAGLRGMRTKIIDSLDQLGGQLMALYPEKYIYDVPGFKKILAKDLARNFIEQGLQYGATVCLNERVLNLIPGEIITLETDKGVHYSRTVVIAAGVGAFNPRKLNVPGAKEFEGKGIYYFVLNKEEFRDKRVLVVGGGDSAVDWALNLQGIAKEVTLIHRRDGFRAHEESVRQLFHSQARVKVFYEVRAFHGKDRLEAVTIFHNKTGEEETFPIDAAILALGFLANLGPIREWGLEIVNNNAIRVNSHMETNIPGVYACGDIVDYDGKLKLIATGTGEAAIAVNYAKHYIDPSASIFPGHSSEIVK